MKQCIFAVTLCLMIAYAHADEPVNQLPNPRYEPDPADPAWLTYAAQFHGHLGPWATAGLRAGMAGRQAVDADGYFDVLVVAVGPFVKPPRSCFLDGLQVSTGATLGKRNLKWVKSDEIVVRFENTNTGKVAELRLSEKLIHLLASIKPAPKAAGTARDDRDHRLEHVSLEDIARKIAKMPESELVHITARTVGLPGSGGKDGGGTKGSATRPTPSFTHEITDSAEYYKDGPQQARPPDGTFKPGTKVTLVRRAGSYWLVRSERGIVAYVASEAVKEISDRPQRSEPSSRKE